MSAQDLAADITAAIGRFDPTVCDTPSPRIVELLADDLAERWARRPQVVTTAAELDELPFLSVVIDPDGDAHQKLGRLWREGKSRRSSHLLAELFDVPEFVVVWSPPAETDDTDGDNDKQGGSHG